MDSSSVRKHSRIKLNLRCRLIWRDGEDYTASLGNISFGGALLITDTETHFKVGDLFDMILILNMEERPKSRTCEIVWLESKQIGVKFLTQDYGFNAVKGLFVLVNLCMFT